MSKTIINTPGEYSCTGCGACSVVCPCNAINISINNEGFWAPVVNADLCVECGLCQKVCYKYQFPTKHVVNIEHAQYFGTFSSDLHVHKKTTSGGIAYELTRWGIENGYKVLGVRYNYNDHIAEHIIISNIEDIDVLRGSKYLQSSPVPALTELIQEAKACPERKYICFGTPCQIFGLKLLIDQNKLSNEFILVDLFCHGVPSYLVWNPYVANIQNRLGAIKNVNFRSKVNGWHQYTMQIEGELGSYTDYAYNDPFYRFFFDNVALNGSCYNCGFRKNKSAADLRLGDFLGKVYEHREDGVSAVVAVSPVGVNLVKVLSEHNRIVVDRHCDAKDCLISQSTEDYSTKSIRDEVINRLAAGEGLHNVSKWYSKQFPLRVQIKNISKTIISKLPNSLVILVRRIIRSV